MQTSRHAHSPRRVLAGRTFNGPPFALPPLLDRWSERWWSLPPRVRFVAAALVVGLALTSMVVRVASSPYGPPQQVLVAATDLPIGHQIVRRDLRVARWPADLVPADALPSDAREDIERRFVTATALAGSVVTGRHLADLGIAAAVPPGWSGVPVPHSALPPLAVGMRVAVIAHQSDGGATQLAADALVIGEDDDRVWLAVDSSLGPRIAAAAAAGRLTAVVHGTDVEFAR